MRARVRKLGGSFYVVIPKDVARAGDIRVGDEVLVDLKKAPNLEEVFGSLKGWKKPTQRIKDELREGW